MNHDSALNYLIAKFDEEMSDLADHIVHGTLNEAEYKFLCGKLHGLELAKNYVKDLAKRLEAADE